MQTLRWTRAEYARLTADGYFDGRRVELIEGELIEMPAMRGPHAAALIKAGQALRASIAPGYHVREQLPLALDEANEPEPDLAVVPGEPDDYVDEHPHLAPLVVEVSDTTLAFDRGRKAGLYARVGLPEYWIVNLVERQLEVLREPVPDATAAGGWRYGARASLGPNEAVTPVAVPCRPIDVGALLPRQR